MFIDNSILAHLNFSQNLLNNAERKDNSYHREQKERDIYSFKEINRDAEKRN